VSETDQDGGTTEGDPGSDDADELDEVGRESFPASDPPASWAGPAEDEPDAEE
jgi:hypothetical protein